MSSECPLPSVGLRGVLEEETCEQVAPVSQVVRTNQPTSSSPSYSKVRPSRPPHGIGSISLCECVLSLFSIGFQSHTPPFLGGFVRDVRIVCKKFSWPCAKDADSAGPHRDDGKERCAHGERGKTIFSLEFRLPLVHTGAVIGSVGRASRSSPPLFLSILSLSRY